MQDTKDISATYSGTYTLGGDLNIYRLGFGAMRITGNGIWGAPVNTEEAIAVLRRALELGVNFIDTADAYGPEVSEKLIAEALYPYPKQLVIATKGGYQRSGPNQWTPNGHPEHLKKACESSLKRLKLDRIDLYQLHTPDLSVPFEQSIEALAQLQAAGKIRHIGLSNVNVQQLQQAREMIEVVSVQNRYNLTDRASESLIDICEHEGLGFIPWYPLATGDLTEKGGQLDQIAKRHSARVSQVVLAWLLQRSKAMLPIPGTSSVQHLEENIGCTNIKLTRDEFNTIATMQF